jgi:hypothetical protein
MTGRKILRAVTSGGGGGAIDTKDGYCYFYGWWNRHPGGVIVTGCTGYESGPGQLEEIL